MNNAQTENRLRVNSINDLLSATGSPYVNAQDCVDKCYGLEFSDVYAASLLINKLDNLISEELKPDSQLLCELFHVFLALLYKQRLGNSCLFIDDIADKTLWLAPDLSNEKDAFRFSEVLQIQRYFEQVSTAVDKLEAIELVWPRLYTRRFYHYESILCEAIFTRLSNKHVKEQNTTEFVDLAENPSSSISDDVAFEHTIQAHWSQVFDDGTNVLSPQGLAVLNTLVTKFSIITGAAGTGKTYSVARLIYLAYSCLSIAPNHILLLVPTGKAANRLQESINTELMDLKPVTTMPLFYQDLLNLKASTLHRVLKVNPTDGQAKFNVHNKLSAKLAIIDEASMVDLSLMTKLVLALPEDCQIVLIGDPNQLPSVEAGCILADIVRYSGTSVSQTKLNTLYGFLGRQLPENTNVVRVENELPEFSTVGRNICVELRKGLRSVEGINQVANAMLEGDLNSIVAQSVKLREKARAPWHFVELDKVFASKNFKIGHFVDEYVQNTLAPHFKNVAEQNDLHDAWCILSNFVCLSPFRVGAFGTEKLNQRVFKTLKLSVANQAGFLQGQALMIEKNDYALQLFNGDIGIVWPDERGQFWAWFPDSSVHNENLSHTGNHLSERKNGLTFRQFSLYTLPKNSAAYALTIHKTQGSEYAMVDILLPEIKETLVTRQLLYTAITRAKLSATLYSSKQILHQTMQNNVKRSSGLETMLSKADKVLSGASI